MKEIVYGGTSAPMEHHGRSCRPGRCGAPLSCPRPGPALSDDGEAMQIEAPLGRQQRDPGHSQRRGEVRSPRSKHARVELMIAIVLLIAVVLTSCDATRSRITRPTPRASSNKALPDDRHRDGPRRPRHKHDARPSSDDQALHGDIVTIDPGHNGDNYPDPKAIDTSVWNGREEEACDTTGTETDGGYTEAQFNFNVAQDLTADLEDEGATVVETRTTNTGRGPCVAQRRHRQHRPFVPPPSPSTPTAGPPTVGASPSSSPWPTG